MLEFWGNLSWTQAIVLIFAGVPLGLAVIVFMFFIFGGEISFSSKTKDKDKTE